jgi:outer membrane protein assembly factor BamB
MRGARSSGGDSRVRWWPAAVIAAAAALALGWVWLSGGDRTRQERVVLTLPILLGASALLTLWFIAFSRIAPRVRVAALGVLLAAGIAGAATLRVRGVTGDLVPILEWRWASSSAPAPEQLPAVPSAEPSPSQTPAMAPDRSVPEPATSPTPTASTAPSTPAAAASAPLSVDPAREYPQFLGPQRNGVVTGIHLATNWERTPPRLVWRRPIGQGWSGFAVSGGIAVTQEQRGAKEMVVAYKLADGAPLWSHSDNARFESTVAGDGPRATPTIAGGRVFTLGSTGILNCLDLATGQRRWRRDIVADNSAVQPAWGRSGSPLVVDDLVVVSVGAANGPGLVAYRRDSGEPAWRAGHDLASYSSPLVTTLAGIRQIVILNEASVSAHDPADGRLLWEYPWPPQQPTVAQPLVLPGDRLLLSAGYGVGSKLLHVAAGPDGTLHASPIWETTRMKAKFTNLVVHDGFVYGLDDGVLVCLDLADGERRWKGGRYGHGQVLLVGGVLLVQTEDGDVILVEPRPDALKELTRMSVFAQKTWNPPALAGRLLVMRTDAEAVCYELPGDGDTQQ